METFRKPAKSARSLLLVALFVLPVAGFVVGRISSPSEQSTRSSRSAVARRPDLLEGRRAPIQDEDASRTHQVADDSPQAGASQESAPPETKEAEDEAEKERETERRLLDISKYEKGLEDLSREFGLSFELSALPYSARDGIRRQKKYLIPEGLEVPEKARKVLYRLTEIRVASHTVCALTTARWCQIPSLREKVKELDTAYALATGGDTKRIRDILYFYGHKQGLTDEQIYAMRDASGKRKQ